MHRRLHYGPAEHWTQVSILRGSLWNWFCHPSMNSGRTSFDLRQDRISTRNLVASKAQDAAWTNRSEVFRHLGLDPGIAAATVTHLQLLVDVKSSKHAPQVRSAQIQGRNIFRHLFSCTWVQRKQVKKYEKQIDHLYVQKTPWNSAQSGHILAGF